MSDTQEFIDSTLQSVPKDLYLVSSSCEAYAPQIGLDNGIRSTRYFSEPVESFVVKKVGGVWKVVQLNKLKWNEYINKFTSRSNARRGGSTLKTEAREGLYTTTTTYDGKSWTKIRP